MGKTKISTDVLFNEGKITTLMDGNAGSSGKGKLASFVAKHCSKDLILMTTNSPNASHTVKDGDVEIVFKTLPSASLYAKERGWKIFIGHGAVIDVEALKKEMGYCGLSKKDVYVDARTPIVQKIDKDYEAGYCTFNGEYTEKLNAGTVKTGTTASGSGSARARKCLRDEHSLLAKDCAELKSIANVLDDMPMLIISHLENGKCGLLEVGQGFPLSYGWRFAPYTTSRNVTVSAAFDDMMLPPKYCGNVIINFRTFPIKIHSYKYLSKETGEYLTYPEVKSMDEKDYITVDSYSGDFYPDQEEISWGKLSKMCGEDIMEITTLTKLPRRVATFSKQNLREAIILNQPPDNYNIYLSVNFVNYVDSRIKGVSTINDGYVIDYDVPSKKVKGWIDYNISEFFPNLICIGTGADTDDYITSSLLTDEKPWRNYQQ